MASITTRSNGLTFIQFVGDGKRHTVSLGRVSRDYALTFKANVEALDVARTHGQPIHAVQAGWLSTLPDAIHAKLSAAGLVAPRQIVVEAPAAPVLADFLETFIAGRTDLAANSVRNLHYSRKSLLDHFGPYKPIDKITALDAQAFLRFLKARYAPGTATQMVKHAKLFLQAAVDGELLARNPFEKVRGSASKSTARQHFITRDVAAQVIDACPDRQWRLIVALSRYGGLRCPSEHLVLKWSDVNWDKRKFRVDSPKTGERWVPIFPELAPFLDEVWTWAQEQGHGLDDYVITRYRGPDTNLRDFLDRIIVRAGLTPWPKPFHNLRASRETELAAEFPIHVVCQWIGNSVTIAAKHYLQVTEGDFEKAAGPLRAVELQQHGEELRALEIPEREKMDGFGSSGTLGATVQTAVQPGRLLLQVDERVSEMLAASHAGFADRNPALLQQFLEVVLRLLVLAPFHERRLTRHIVARSIATDDDIPLFNHGLCPHPNSKSAPASFRRLAGAGSGPRWGNRRAVSGSVHGLRSPAFSLLTLRLTVGPPLQRESGGAQGTGVEPAFQG